MNSYQIFCILFASKFIAGVAAIKDPVLCPEEKCCKRFMVNHASTRQTIHVSASSSWSEQVEPQYAGLFEEASDNHLAGWAPRYNRPTEWIQVDFGSPTNVTGILLQGRGDKDRWIREFRVVFSDDIQHFYSTKTMEGAFDRNTVIRCFFDVPIEARYFRIHTVNCKSYPGLRFDLLGC